MLAFAVKRLAIALLVALTVSLITFSMIYVSGDPAIAIARERARPPARAAGRPVLRLRMRGGLRRARALARAGGPRAARLRALVCGARAGGGRDLRAPPRHY